MKKIIVGLVIFSLMFTVSAHAEQFETIVGKLVQGVFPVQVDGNKLDKEAIVIDGTTYLPVRAFGEAIGYEVTFDSELGISMSRKVDQERQDEIKRLQEESKRLQEEAKRIQREGKLQELLTNKEVYEIKIKAFQEDMKTYTDKLIIDKIQIEIDKAKAELEKVNIELNELESLE